MITSQLSTFFRLGNIDQKIIQALVPTDWGQLHLSSFFSFFVFGSLPIYFEVLMHISVKQRRWFKLNLLKEMRSRTGKKMMLWLTTIREQKKKRKKKKRWTTSPLKFSWTRHLRERDCVSYILYSCSKLHKPFKAQSKSRTRNWKTTDKSTPLQQSIEVISW